MWILNRFFLLCLRLLDAFRTVSFELLRVLFRVRFFLYSSELFVVSVWVEMRVDKAL